MEVINQGFMCPAEFFLAYEQHCDKTLAQFKKEIETTKAKCLDEVTISDLCSMPNHPNGLYFIFGENPFDANTKLKEFISASEHSAIAAF